MLHAAEQRPPKVGPMPLEEVPRLARASEIEANLDQRQQPKVLRTLEPALRPARDGFVGLAFRFERLIGSEPDQAEASAQFELQVDVAALACRFEQAAPMVCGFPKFSLIHQREQKEVLREVELPCHSRAVVAE